MAKRKRTNKDLQNITNKTKDRVTQTPLNTGDELMFSGRESRSCSTSGTHRVNNISQWDNRLCDVLNLSGFKCWRQCISVRQYKRIHLI
jgi:hypothetical protein